ncbi:MAG: low-complexity tail membrane protein [Leptolyngbyaceae cyanobacterium SM2_3_12]|nr:low-complexity tail membrane protein [Leptolyngbyaceae cyanobacterium SM2_3_12]
MAAYRYDPYLWLHLAGVATVPLWLDLVLLGLAVDYPTFPNLELGILMAVGVLPVLVMQLMRPFCIFSLVLLVLKPSALDDDRRRLLTLFRHWRIRLGALLVPLPLVWVLLWLYALAPVATDITPFASLDRAGGLALAAGGFFMANLFLQVPVSVLKVLLMSESQVKAANPYPLAQVTKDFTLIGLSVGKILPRVLPPASTPSPPAEPTSLSSPAQTFRGHHANGHQPLIPSDPESGAEPGSALDETPLDETSVIQTPVAESPRNQPERSASLGHSGPDSHYTDLTHTMASPDPGTGSEQAEPEPLDARADLPSAWAEDAPQPAHGGLSAPQETGVEAARAKAPRD